MVLSLKCLSLSYQIYEDKPFSVHDDFKWWLPLETCSVSMFMSMSLPFCADCRSSCSKTSRWQLHCIYDLPTSLVFTHSGLPDDFCNRPKSSFYKSSCQSSPAGAREIPRENTEETSLWRAPVKLSFSHQNRWRHFERSRCSLTDFSISGDFLLPKRPKISEINSWINLWNVLLRIHDCSVSNNVNFVLKSASWFFLDSLKTFAKFSSSSQFSQWPPWHFLFISSMQFHNFEFSFAMLTLHGQTSLKLVKMTFVPSLIRRSRRGHQMLCFWADFHDF